MKTKLDYLKKKYMSSSKEKGKEARKRDLKLLSKYQDVIQVEKRTENSKQ